MMCVGFWCCVALQDIQLKDLHRTRAALYEVQQECSRLKHQLELTQQ